MIRGYNLDGDHLASNDHDLEKIVSYVFLFLLYGVFLARWECIKDV